MKKTVSIFLALGLIGCGATLEQEMSKISKIGKDTYMLNDRLFSHELAGDKVQIANAFCQKLKKDLLLKTQDKTNRRINLVFLCLDSDDTRYVEANPKSKADITIEGSIKN